MPPARRAGIWSGSAASRACTTRASARAWAGRRSLTAPSTGGRPRDPCVESVHPVPPQAHSISSGWGFLGLDSRFKPQLRTFSRR